jgi:hypothetical protein
VIAFVISELSDQMKSQCNERGQIMFQIKGRFVGVIGIDMIDKFVWILSDTIENDKSVELGKQIDGLKEE